MKNFSSFCGHITIRICNAFSGLLQALIGRLQRVQICVARLVTPYSTARTYHTNSAKSALAASTLQVLILDFSVHVKIFNDSAQSTFGISFTNISRPDPFALSANLSWLSPNLEPPPKKKAGLIYAPQHYGTIHVRELNVSAKFMNLRNFEKRSFLKGIYPVSMKSTSVSVK